MSRSPFVDHDDWTLDVNQLLREALPLVVLVGLVGFVALLPLGIAVYTGIAPLAFTLLSQFMLVIGSGLVLLYVIARGIQLAEE